MTGDRVPEAREVLAAVEPPRAFLTALIDERAKENPHLEPMHRANHVNDVARHLDQACPFLKDLREDLPDGKYRRVFQSGIAMASMDLQGAIVGETT